MSKIKLIREKYQYVDQQTGEIIVFQAFQPVFLTQ